MTLLVACSTGVELDRPFGDNLAWGDSTGEFGDDYGETSEGDADETTGDGDGDSTTTPANAYCQPAEAWNANWVAYANQVVDYINEIRAGGRDCGALGVLPPAPPLAPSEALTCASRVHSGDMASRDYFDHTTPEGKDPGWRFEQAGFTGQHWAENIGAGYPLATDVVDGWLESEIHCGNMLNASYTQIGVGYAFGPTAAYAHYWTLALGD